MTITAKTFSLLILLIGIVTTFQQRLPQPLFNLILILTTVIITVSLLNIDLTELIVESPFTQGSGGRIGIRRVSAGTHDFLNTDI